MMKCFVACAFGKNDIDELYDKTITKALLKYEITPLRVDRFEHNNNIDQQIIQMIKESSFCISDLTYARPSVYYESGFANGLGKDVIYTVRKDHFSPRTDDENGNLRVHFDLQMKNIIDWTNKNLETTFLSRLEKRIEFIYKPLIEKEHIESIHKSKIKNFSMLSVNSRLWEVRDTVQKVIKKEKWKPAYSNDWNKKNNIVKSFCKDNVEIFLYFLNSATIHEIVQIKYRLRDSLTYDKNEKKAHVFILSIRSIPKTRLEDVFPSSKCIEYGKIYQETINKGMTITYHLVYGKKYAEEYIDDVEKSLNFIEGMN
jgi:hypothetical protein